jgi:hypothetical protein
MSVVYQAMGTWGIIDPNPVGAVISKPVLATVLVVTSGATHIDGLLPAGSKAICKAYKTRRQMEDEKTRWLELIDRGLAVDG